MSRTYRNKNYTGYYTGRRELDGIRKHDDTLGYTTRYYQETWERYQLEIHKDGSAWNMSTPMWWYHQENTVPRRAKETILIKQVLRLIDYEDSPEFPLDKKPHIYYW